MGRMERKYSPEQKDAALGAYLDRGVRPRSSILEMAKVGQLLGADGTPVPAFDMPDGTFAGYIRDERKRRTGRARRDIAAAPARDAIEQLRRRCVSAADALLDDFDKQLRSRSNGADPERLRQIVRVVREAAALPGPDDPRSPRPGAKVEGKREGGEQKPNSTLAGQIMADVRGQQAGPLQNTSLSTDLEGQRAGEAQQQAEGSHDDGDNARPGSLASELAAHRALAPV